MRNILTICILLLSLTVCSAQKKGNVNFLNLSLEQAFEQAKKDGKQVFVNYSTKGCTPCKIMENTVYTNPSLAKKMNDNFVCIKLDPIEDKSIENRARYEHKVSGFPTFIFFNLKGEIVSNDVGFKSVEEMTQLVDKALK
ncbi:DUF255 domain-containing protein [Ancylomarina salipaludis]|uniref:DUF255 domain-containing protein n=1 Tax=Ancylomarina salipaludis TaxID=2501299 RepID=A0A4Q1JKR0_9BACT|nr:thioredoxin family protein [Ancylomarina salipaludis]RXQ93943.1 DUF255 domain-containing protein [Ancylomarina salipaludis]